MIYTKVPKALIDFNRQPASEFLVPQGTLSKKGLTVVNPEQWTTYMDAMTFLREAKNVIYRKYGGGWEINFHTQSHSRMISAGVGNKNKLKTLFSDPTLVRSDLEKTTAKSGHFYTYNYDAHNISFYDGVYGKYALVEIMNSRGVGAAPSRSFQWPQDGNKPKCYCGNTAMESHFAPLTEEEAKLNNHELDLKTSAGRPDEDWYVGTWNSAIAEQNNKFVDESNNMDDLVEMWGETIIDLSVELYGVDVNTDYDRPYRSLMNTYNNVIPATYCTDGKIKSLKPICGLFLDSL